MTTSPQQSKSKPAVWACYSNLALVTILALVTVFYLLAWQIETVFLALVTAALTVGIYYRYSQAYFALASLAFGAFWLAKMGMAFIGPKSVVMGLSMALLVLALVLHESLARRPKAGDPEDSADD